MIAENLRERSIKQLQSMIKECREQRKKSLDDYNKIKRQLDKQQDLLVKVSERKTPSSKNYLTFSSSLYGNMKNVMIQHVVRKKVTRKRMKI